MSITYTVNARLDDTTLITIAGDILVDRLDADVLVVRGGLTDITSDVIQNSVSWTKGITGKGPMDRIATTGNLSFSVRNGANNSTGLVGAYSPDNTNCRAGWTVGAGIQLIETNGTVNKYSYWRISEIEPEPGLYGSRQVKVTAVDFIDQLSSQKIKGLYIKLLNIGGSIINYVLASMTITPQSSVVYPGDYVFPVALDATEKDESTTVYSVINEVVMSDLGCFYSPTDTTYGETVRYDSYSIWNAKTSVGTFTDNMTGLKITRNANKIYNDIRTTVYPRRIETSTGTLTQLDYEMAISAGSSVAINMRYLDQTSAVRVAAYETQTQVAGTDYKFSSVSGNGGSDMNASLGRTIDLSSSNTANATLTNNGTVTGYLNLFQIRGKAIKTYTQIETVSSDNPSIAQFGRRTLRYMMPYQSDPVVGQAIAVLLLAAYKSEVSDVDGLRFITSTPALETAAMTYNIGDKITLNETVTGISSKNFYIGSEQHSLDLGHASVEYGLIPA